MRDLTAEELNIAPDWATHYEFGPLGDLIFADEVGYCILWLGRKSLSPKRSHGGNLFLEEGKPIPQKQPDFNLYNYEFIDEDISDVDKDENIVVLHLDCNVVTLQKSDVIALAKHFKITPEDLK